MTFKTITPFSDQYKEMIDLRVRVLLLPIGIPASYIVPEKEAEDLFIGAYEEDKLVGCCVLTNRQTGQVQLRQMAVETSLQHRGLGRAIITFAEEKAREHGFSLLYLHARNPVVLFYEKCGYHKAGPQFFEVGLAHYRMEKAL